MQSRSLWSLVPATIGFLSVVLAHSAPALPESPNSVDAWIRQMEAHFDVRADLKETKGSGWKPFNRIKWLHEGRSSASGGKSEALARWRVLGRAEMLKAARGGRSEPQWRCLGPTNIAGRILAMAFRPGEPKVMYAGAASGGIWRSIDGGQAWQPVDDALPTLSVGAIAIPVNAPNTIIIGTGEPTVGRDGIYGLGILRSIDAGQTWQQTNVVQDPFLPRMGYHAIEVNPRTGVLLAAGSEGILRSEDNGANWTTVVSGGNWTDVKWRPGSSDSALAVQEYGGVFLSADGGVTYQQVIGGLPNPADMGGLAKIAWSESDSRSVYLGCSAADSFTVLGIYRSTDCGATWELRSRPTYFYGFQGFYNNTIVVSPSNPMAVLVGGLGISRSSDGGSTWQGVGYNVHVDHHAIAYRPGSATEIWVGTDGGVFRSGDSGLTWEDRNAGLVTLQLYDACSAPWDSTVGYGGAQDNGIPRYLGTGEWSENFGGDGMICHCDPSNPLHAYSEYQRGYRISTQDGFATWSEITRGLVGPERWVAPLDMDLHDPMHLVTATQTGIYSTMNGGNLWSRIGDGNDVVSIALSPIASSRIWAQERSSGKVRTSTDGGETWTVTQAAPFARIGGTKILADPRDSVAAYCTYLHHPARPPLVLRTTDGGTTWSDVTGDLGEQSVNTIAVDPTDSRRWFAGTDIGVWTTENAGLTWRPYGLGLPNVLVLDLEFRGLSGELRAATFGRGLWSINTNMEGVVQPPLASHAFLSIATGNPAGRQISLRFASQAGAHQQVSVYSIAGREVATLVNGISDGLNHLVTWKPVLVPAGVYIAVLRTRSSQVARKIVLLR